MILFKLHQQKMIELLLLVATFTYGVFASCSTDVKQKKILRVEVLLFKSSSLFLAK